MQASARDQLEHVRDQRAHAWGPLAAEIAAASARFAAAGLPARRAREVVIARW